MVQMFFYSAMIKRSSANVLFQVHHNLKINFADKGKLREWDKESIRL